MNPFKDEVLFDVSPIGVSDVFLGQLYIWKHYVAYESRPCSFIITMCIQLKMILEVALSTKILLVSTK
jgi:hypothetical protein